MSHSEELPDDPIFAEELARSDIDSLELAHYLYDGKEKYDRLIDLTSAYALDPQVKYQYNEFDNTRKETFYSQNRKLARLREITKEKGMPPIDYTTSDEYSPPLNTISSTSLHHSMFETVLRILGSEEQVKEFLPKILSYEVLGCYAQTEMGHGSDVQGLQTKAVYDKETDEFVVSTPSVMATKFWPGELGKQANYCVFHAKMIINGQSMGVNAFICRIRNEDAHEPLRGLEIGDIGPKYGYSGKDNGYMIFTDFRIPRTALLSRFISLEKGGNLNIQGDPKVAYATMLYVRISLVNYTWRLAISSCYLGVMYTLLRKQFKTIANSSEERRIFDYQATQHQIIPFLSYSYACVFSSKQCVVKYEKMISEIKDDNFSTMRDLHSIVSAFKGLQMQESLTGFFKIRECCGAHGYLSYSNMPNLIEIWSPNVTLEGDTIVMYLQNAKGFIKTFRLVQNHGKKIKGIYKFLNNYKEYVGATDHQGKFTDSESLLKLLQAATVMSINKTSDLLPEIDDEINYDVAWNKTYQIDIISSSLLNAHYLIASMFAQELDSVKLSKNLMSVMNKMLCVYLCDVITKFGQQLILNGYLKGNQLMKIKDFMDEIITEIRPHAYKLTSSYIPHNEILHSAIARKSGKMYETLYEVSSRSKLNNKTKLDSFDENIRPLQKKLRGIAKI